VWFKSLADGDASDAYGVEADIIASLGGAVPDADLDSAGYDSMVVSILTLFKAAMGDFDLDVLRENEPIFGPIFMLIYLFVGAVMLLNLLIAILSDVYANVQEKSSEEFSFAKAKACCDFRVFWNGMRTHVSLPAPLNMVSIMLYPAEVVVARIIKTVMGMDSVTEKMKMTETNKDWWGNFQLWTPVNVYFFILLSGIVLGCLAWIVAFVVYVIGFPFLLVGLVLGSFGAFVAFVFGDSWYGSPTKSSIGEEFGKGWFSKCFDQPGFIGMFCRPIAILIEFALGLSLEAIAMALVLAFGAVGLVLAVAVAALYLVFAIALVIPFGLAGAFITSLQVVWDAHHLGAVKAVGAADVHETSTTQNPTTTPAADSSGSQEGDPLESKEVVDLVKWACALVPESEDKFPADYRTVRAIEEQAAPMVNSRMGMEDKIDGVLIPKIEEVLKAAAEQSKQISHLLGHIHKTEGIDEGHDDGHDHGHDHGH
jgi:hypothetical protein